MRKSRFGEAKIVGNLRELKAGEKAATLCREHGISETTRILSLTRTCPRRVR